MIRALEDKVYQLTYKVPVKVIPPVNGFLVLADEPILIDGGISDDETFASFEADLATLGLKPLDIKHALVTHNHLDHIGLASRLAAMNPNLKVHVHEEEWYMVNATDAEREGFRSVLASIIVSWGVPADIVDLMKEKIVKYLRLGGGIPRSQVLPYPANRKPFTVAGITLEAIHCPGHTEGLVCLWWPEKQKIFSNDHLLEDVTPNPTLYIRPRNGKRCGLADYIHSLSFIENLPIKQALPGHGLPFTEVKARIEEVRGLCYDRRRKIIENLPSPDEEPTTILELTQKIWTDLDPVSMFLASREVHGFIEMMTDEGLINVELDGDVRRLTLSRAGTRAENRQDSSFLMK